MAPISMPFPAPIDALLADFAVLDDWEERYRYVVELGEGLERLGEADYSDANKVAGCASQVWLVARRAGGRLHLKGDSDAHIVRGLIAILLRLYSGRKPAEIARDDAEALFAKLGLSEHLTAQRANGFRAMVERIAEIARGSP